MYETMLEEIMWISAS